MAEAVLVDEGRVEVRFRFPALEADEGDDMVPISVWPVSKAQNGAVTIPRKIDVVAVLIGP